jgi:general L-amino acid transport system permease protein
MSAADTAYLRVSAAETLPPPTATAGILGWMRTNLFSSIPNTILTLVALAFVLWIVPPLLNFLIFHAVWSGSNRDACLAEKVGHPVGACWAFVGTRFGYFMYGQYPFDERWRVNLTWALGAIGIVWLLWPRLGAKAWAAAYFFVLFPLIAFWLLSGGLGLLPVPTNLWGGVLITLVIASVGIVVSLPLGIVLALGRRSSMPIVKILTIIFIEVVRGVPLITVLFMANFMLPLFLPIGWRPDSLLRCLIGVALFSAAYMAEVVRGGLQAMPRGQYEGAQALGLNYPMMMVFIILPQALKMVIPGIVNSFISLFKDTSLVAIVGIYDLLKTIEASNNDPNWATPVTSYTGYAFAALFFWVFCFGMSRYSMWVERRLDTGHKR